MAGMADFYLRWGDKLNQGIGQIAGAGDQLLAADQREGAAQNELAQFVERRAASRRSERQTALAEMEAQRKREAEDKEQQRKDAEYQRAMEFIKLIQEGKKIANADPRLAQGAPKPVGPTREDMAYLEDETGTVMPPQSVGGSNSTALMGQALNSFPGEAANGRVPYSREEIPDLALQYGQMKPSEYMTSTKPEKEKLSPLEELEIYRAKREIDASILAGRPLTPYQEKMLAIYEDRLSGDHETKKLEGRNLANSGKTLVQGLRPLPDAYITPDDVKVVKQSKSVYDSIKDGMQDLATDYQKYGIELWGAHAGEMETTTRNIQLQLKEFYNLGVLNGPDLALMEQQLPNISELKSMGREAAFGVYQAKVAKLGQLLEKTFQRKMNTYGFEVGAPRPRPSAAPTAGGQRDFGKEYGF